MQRRHFFMSSILSSPKKKSQINLNKREKNERQAQNWMRDRLLKVFNLVSVDKSPSNA